MNRPSTTEYHPNYQRYVDMVSSADFFESLQENTAETLQFFKTIDPDKHTYRYAPEKWTVKDVLMHIIDTERGFSYRAIVCVRCDDKTPLYPMDEDLYAANVDTTNRTMASLLDEFLAVRTAFSSVFTFATTDQLTFLGNGAGHKISARALGYIAIGHVMHHVNVVRERYL